MNPAQKLAGVGLALLLVGCGSARAHHESMPATSTTSTSTTTTTSTVPPTTTTTVPPPPPTIPPPAPEPAPGPQPAPAPDPVPPAPAPSYPSISKGLVTPTEPLVYGWVMIDAWTSWGVQIGPKVDGSGSHVAIYAWRECSGFASTGQCAWTFFQEYAALAPGSVHQYAIAWGPGGWQLSADGRTLAVLDVGPDGGHAESAYEKTTS